MANRRYWYHAPTHLKNINGKKPTYYNPEYKEKYTYDGPNNSLRLLHRVRGSIGGNLLFPTGPTSTNTTNAEVIKVFMNSIVSDNANMVTIGIIYFYLRTDLPQGDEEFIFHPSSSRLITSKPMWSHPNRNKKDNLWFKDNRLYSKCYRIY